MKERYSIIGAMAGSSMDGLDLAHAVFTLDQNEWKYQIKKCETIPYDKVLFDELKQSPSQNLKNQKKLDLAFGDWIGDKINAFKVDLDSIDLLGVHGHTVVHEPHNKVSWQLGNGKHIAKKTGLPTITDFRTLDVENDGQGAPLVPFGDFSLFKEFDACLNLGGIANISINAKKMAWDICPCNQVLNFFASQLGFDFDDSGHLAREGKFDKEFYTLLSSNPFFSALPPKSLPNNFINHQVLNSIDPKNGLHTYCHFIADQVAKSVTPSNKSKLLITGGGALNSYLIELITEKTHGWQIDIPDQETIAFKESLVFAFLALKRFRNEINVLASVTGASKDTSSGVIHLP